MRPRYFILVFLLFVVLVGSPQAEVYKWVDEKGGTHFTEYPATIPEMYREKANSMQMGEDSKPIQERIKNKQGTEGAAETYDYKTIPPKNRYTKDEFETSIIGKTKGEIITSFGNPSSIQTSTSYGNEYWYYRGGIVRDPVTKTVFLVYDPITEKVFGNIQIIFEYRTVRAGVLSTKKDYFAVRINY